MMQRSCSTIVPIISISFPPQHIGSLKNFPDLRKIEPYSENASMRHEGEKKKNEKYLAKELVSPFARHAGEEDTKTRLERNGNGGSPKSFYFGSRFLSRAAPPLQPGTRYANFLA